MTARFIERLALASLLGALALSAHAQNAGDLAPLLFAPQLPPAKFFASTDPQHQNHDFIELKPGETRRVKLAAGQLVRLWSTATAPETLSLSLQRDAQTVPLLKNGRALQGELHAKAFTFYPTLPQVVLTSDVVLVATNTASVPNKWFYQAMVGNFVWKPLPGYAPGRHVSHLEERNAPEVTASTWTLPGSGVISEIAVQADAPSFALWSGLRLRARWNGATRDAVDVPLGELAARFENGSAPSPLRSAVCDFDGRRLVLRWPMPFQHGAKISLTRTAPGLPVVRARITVAQTPGVPPMQFHAVQGSARSQPGAPIPILRVKGAGAFVGLAMSVASAADSAARSFAFLEGNETLRADGRKFEGTGTEDFFNAAWYFPDAPFAQDFGGMTFKRKLPPAVAAYRWMIRDAVPFKRDFAFDFEHDSGNRRADLEYRWVAFWYQAAGGTSQVPNTLPRGANPAPRRAAANSPANGTARADWRFMFAATGLLMAAIAAFFVRRHLQKP